MESTVYRVIVINQQKVIVSLDRTLNDTLLQAVNGDIIGIMMIQSKQNLFARIRIVKKIPATA